MKKLYFLTFVGCLLMSNSYGQSWSKGKGNGFYKLDFSTIQSEKNFNNDGEIVDAAKLSNNIFSLYGEYGLTSKMTFQAYVPYVSNSLEDDSQSGLGDIDVSLVYHIMQSKIAVSAQVLVGLPTGNATPDNQLNTGDGELNQMVKINAGTSGAKWWIQGGLGLNNRIKDYSDEVRFNAEFGYKFFNQKLMTIFKLGGVQSLKNGDKAPNPFGLFSNDVQYVSPAIEIMYYATDNIGIALRGAGAGAGATNVQAAPQISASIFMDLK